MNYKMRFITISIALASIFLLSFHVYAGNESKTVHPDIAKIVGMDVVNNKNEELGEIDNLIVSSPDNILFAIVSVGGFLGIGDKLVAVPVDDISFEKDKAILNVSKETMKSAPEFHYGDPFAVAPNLKNPPDEADLDPEGIVR